MSYTQLKKSFRYEGRYTISKYIGRSSRKLPTQKLGPYTIARKFSKKDAAGYSICYIDKQGEVSYFPLTFRAKKNKTQIIRKKFYI